ncbi:hypothetical protein ACN47E_007784 [Coniothyrium glycines]
MFTPVETTIGAVLLQQATSNLLYQNGNILGASGLIRQLFSAPTRETLAFFAGMVLSILPLKAFVPQLVVYPSTPLTLQTAVITIGTAVLVGWGTKTSNGCTSGHMLCGLPRLSGRSAAATAIFFPVAMITHHLMHPTLYTDACPSDTPCYTPVYPPAATTTRLILIATLSIAAARTVPLLLARSSNETHTSSPPTPPAPTKPNSPTSYALSRTAAYFFAGLLFALGLHISQMSQPGKVLSFLSFPVLSHWDPSLLLVIAFAVVPNLCEIHTRGLTTPPTFADKFALPTTTIRDVDLGFVAGAAAFGVGWGLTGTCPGPAMLRAVVQPVWGALWLSGFWAGAMLGA